MSVAAILNELDDTTEMEIGGRVCNVPTIFICPITLAMMDYPLVTRKGLRFERSAIVSWLGKGSGRCPLTRDPMTLSDLIHDRKLEDAIRFWKEFHGIPFVEQCEASCPDDFVSFCFIDAKDPASIRRRAPFLENSQTGNRGTRDRSNRSRRPLTAPLA